MPSFELTTKQHEANELASVAAAAHAAEASSVPKLLDDALPSLTWREKIAYLMRRLDAEVRRLGPSAQPDCPLKHHFAPGIYIREIFMPSGAIVIGKIHRTEHFNIIQQGRVILFGEGSRRELHAPTTFVSKPGVQKVLYIEEDTVWSTVHLTEERDLEALEREIIEPDDSYPRIDRTAERLAIAEAAAAERRAIGGRPS